MPLQDSPDWQRPYAQTEQVLYNATHSVATLTYLTLSSISMDSYQSYTLTIRAYTTVAATAYDRVMLRVYWWSPNAPGSIMQRIDEYDFLAGDNLSAGYPTVDGLLRISDHCHGNMVIVQLINFSPDTLSMEIALYGSTRNRPTRELRGGEASVPDSNDTTTSHLVDDPGFTIGGGTIVDYAPHIHEGFVYYEFEATTQQFTFETYQPFGTLVHRWVLAAGTTQRGIIAFPAKSMRLRVTNNGAANGTYRCQLIAVREHR